MEGPLVLLYGTAQLCSPDAALGEDFPVCASNSRDMRMDATACASADSLSVTLIRGEWSIFYKAQYVLREGLQSAAGSPYNGGHMRDKGRE